MRINSSYYTWLPILLLLGGVVSSVISQESGEEIHPQPKNEDAQRAFEPNDSPEESYQRKYVINVESRKEECYYIDEVKINQVINFHFVVRYTLRYSTLLFATLRYSTLLYATLGYSTLL
jgi:hypothetical protein